MQLKSNPDGGIRLELDRDEAPLFRQLLERAAFIDTPPDAQHAILKLAEKILAALPD